MNIQKPRQPNADLRVTHWDPTGNILTIDMTWTEWDGLVAEAEALRGAQ